MLDLRTKWAIMWLVVVVCAASLAACGPAVHGPVKVVERDSGSMVELRVGDKLEIVLEANPSSGYAWEMASPDITVVRQEGEAQFKTDSPALGGAGKLTLMFEAVAPGEEMLRMAYRRPLEEGVAPTRVFELDVLVRPRR